jgi:hypothetical protein
METILALLPDMVQVKGLGAVLAAGCVLAALGAAGGGTRLREADLAAGWGLAAALLTGVGTLTALRLDVVAAALTVSAAAGLWRLKCREEAFLPPGAGPAALLLLPLLLLVAAMVPSQWDEFSQWLWNAAYLAEHDLLPRRGLPLHPGSFPGYPFGAAVLPYLAACFAGGLIEQAGALGNILLLGSLGLALARLMAAGQGVPRPGRGMLAAGLLLATLAGPTFVAKVALTAYADTGTAVFLALGMLLGWAMLEALAAGRSSEALALGWKASLVLAGLAAFKQSNLVLLALLGVGLALVVLRDPRISWRRGAVGLAVVFALPLAVSLLWRLHVARHLPGQEFTVRPFSLWALDALPEILSSMGTVAINKGGHFGSMLLLAWLGARSLWRGQGGVGRLLTVATVVALGYQAFLLFSYVAAFDRVEAVAAASYWRYNQHVGALVTLALVAWAAALRPVSLPPRVGTGAAVLAFCLPLLLTPLIRFDRERPKPHLRQVAQQTAPLLAAGDVLAVVEPGDAGFTWLAVRWPLRVAGARVDGLFNLADAGAGTIAARLAGASHVLVRRPTPAVAAVLGVDVPAGTTLLLRREAGGWTILHRWEEDRT